MGYRNATVALQGLVLTWYALDR